MNPPPASPRRWRRRVAVAVLFVALTGVMTWPQALVFHSHSVEHQDVFFNLWRLRWIHHALTSPATLFDGNQFTPERRVLAYSDAMLVEGLIATPLLAAGLPPMLVHNLLLLGAIVASGVGMFVLARHLTRSDAGGVVAGIVFAFAPYRIEHYMHMELQWAFWIPWAFWGLQRTLETGAARFGIFTGAMVALQMLSSIYYGIFLGVLLGLVGCLQLLPQALPAAMRSVRALAAGAALAAAVSWLYSTPYTLASTRVGTRGEHEVRMFSARPRNYLSTTETNLLYGGRRAGPPERRLFPGTVPLLLTLVGLLLVAPAPYVIAYLVGLIAAFELSLGLNGWVYPYLYEHVMLFQGLRAPARASIFCLAFLGLLAAYGHASLAAASKPRLRAALALVLPAVILLEYWVAPLRLVPYANTAPPLYAWLAAQPPGIVAEFPMPRANQLPGDEARYAYMSTFHWKPLVNGYSGYYPPSYLQRLERLEGFPDEAGIRQLRLDRVRYVIVHGTAYDRAEYARLLDGLARSGLQPLGTFPDRGGSAAVFGVP